uniref:Uncharacterized protein n=1 Tax=Rhizophora mucronata TaxID=61149 RepID=A0A2P2NFW6_RHIMU
MQIESPNPFLLAKFWCLILCIFKCSTPVSKIGDRN